MLSLLLISKAFMSQHPFPAWFVSTDKVIHCTRTHYFYSFFSHPSYNLIYPLTIRFYDKPFLKAF